MRHVQNAANRESARRVRHDEERELQVKRATDGKVITEILNLKSF
jgi:hypothetical protein